MPEITPVVNPLAVLVVMLVLGSIVGAWMWAFLRLAFRLPVLPPLTLRVVPWGVGSVLVAFLVWFGTTNVVSLVYFLAIPDKVAKARAEGGILPPVDQMIASALSNAAVVLLVPLSLAATSGARRRDYGLEGSGIARQAGMGLIAYPLLAPCVFGVMLLAVRFFPRDVHPLELAIRRELSPGLSAVMVVAGVVLAPIAEELIFRGVLLGWLTKVALLGSARRPMVAGPEEEAGVMGPVFDPIEAERDAASFTDPHFTDEDRITSFPSSDPKTRDALDRRPRWFALHASNVGVSIIFAALHYKVWPTPIPIFFLSLGLGLLYQRTGGLVAPIALHMAFNGISTLFMFLTVGMTPPKSEKAPNPIPPPARAAALAGSVTPVHLRSAKFIPGHGKPALTHPRTIDTIFNPTGRTVRLGRTIPGKNPRLELAIVRYP